MRQPRKPKARPYSKLERVAREVYKDSNYCSVVALAAATGWSFGKAQAHCSRSGREVGEGMDIISLKVAYRAAGLELESIDPPAATLGASCKRLQKDGIFLLVSTRHITCVRNGTIVDWATESERRRVLRAWKVKGGLV